MGVGGLRLGGLGFGVWGLGFERGFWVLGFGFGVGAGFRVWCSVFGVLGLGFWVQGSVCMLEG